MRLLNLLAARASCATCSRCVQQAVERVKTMVEIEEGGPPGLSTRLLTPPPPAITTLHAHTQVCAARGGAGESDV